MTLKSKDPVDIIQHVYYCLGKDSIPYQDLVFFIAYELKLFSPTSCEKILSIAKERELVTITPEKMVILNVKMLVENEDTKKGPISIKDVLKSLSTSAMMTKSVAIKDDHILNFSHDASKKMLTAKFSGRDGINLGVVIDGSKKEVMQEHQDDLGDLSNKKLFYKYLIKIIWKNKDDHDITRLVREIQSNLDEWTFVYKKIEKK